MRTSNRPLYLFAFLQLAVVALVLLSLSIPDWFDYCWFQFGVGSARSLSLPGSDFEEHLYALHYTLCHWMPDSVPEQHCPGFCAGIKRLDHASGALLFFLVYSAGLGLVSAVLHLYITRAKDFQCPSIRLLIASPALMMITGFGVYCVIADFQSFKPVSKDHNLCEGSGPIDFQPQWGLLLSAALVMLQTLTVLYGFIVTSKRFKIAKK